MKIPSSIITPLVLGIALATLAQPEPASVETTPELPTLMAPGPSQPAANTALSELDPYAPREANTLGGGNRGAIGQVSVLCFSQPDQEKIAETMEDVAVLGFLLSRNLQQAFVENANEYKLGIPMLLTSGNQAIGASYIQGFGAILRMQVRFPVVAPAVGSEEAEPVQTSTEWEEARRELTAGDNPEANSWYFRSPDRTDGHPYDAKLVETLKHRVLLLLKNGSNLRHLKGNEWIIVKVVGTPNSLGTQRNHWSQSNRPLTNHRHDYPKLDAQPENKSPKNAAGAWRASSASNQATILTLRVKKSDADAFAAGSLSEEQFIKKAEVAAYLNPVRESDVSGNAAQNPGMQDSVRAGQSGTGLKK